MLFRAGPGQEPSCFGFFTLIGFFFPPLLSSVNTLKKNWGGGNFEGGQVLEPRTLGLVLCRPNYLYALWEDIYPPCPQFPNLEVRLFKNS